MRAALLLLVLLPSAAAASEVHVSYDGDAYTVGFESDAARPDVRVDGREVIAERVNGTTWRARLPAASLTYSVEGRSFELAAPPARTAATRIAFVADLGTSPDAKAVIGAIIAASPDIVLIGGDLSYAHANASIWSDWFTILEPLASRVPIMPAWGNHEDVCSTGSNTYKPCAPERNQWPARFDLPGDDLFYAFEWGPVRVSVLDTEAWEKDEGKHASGQAEQVEFVNGSLGLDHELWNVVMFHRPLRTTSAREGAASEPARVALEPILDASADLVLAGHLHAYERSRLATQKPLYVTSGGGGRPLYDEWGAEAPWLATRAVDHHFVLLDVMPTRIEGRAVRPNGTTLDSFSIERPGPTPPSPTPPTPSTRPPTAVDPPTAATSPTSSSPIVSPPSAQEATIPFPGWLALVAILVTLSRRRRARRAL